jgi:predicted metal-binding membrane protein
MHHGACCVGCCWGLMIVLVAVGIMDVPAMILLAGVILIEKVWRYGATFSIVVGIVLLIVAALAPFVPWLLPGLHAPATPMM